MNNAHLSNVHYVLLDMIFKLVNVPLDVQPIVLNVVVTVMLTVKYVVMDIKEGNFNVNLFVLIIVKLVKLEKLLLIV